MANKREGDPLAASRKEFEQMARRIVRTAYKIYFAPKNPALLITDRQIRFIVVTEIERIEKEAIRGPLRR